ncbi:hypothetical protein H920_16204 [Fukomys damarensis]|uniref:Uncharacterized protein n=1 Tax=Fukomys damarensis TaxID=885580 RepID=A0A091CWX0_FUKDA|nr:hypothetical protein H920_16204 [Fukomys damarensis]
MGKSIATDFRGPEFFEKNKQKPMENNNKDENNGGVRSQVCLGSDFQPVSSDSLGPLAPMDMLIFMPALQPVAMAKRLQNFAVSNNCLQEE